MSPCTSAGLVLCLILVTCAMLVKTAEIRHTEVGVIVKGELTMNEHSRLKREVRKDMVGFDKNEKKAILQRHNDLRSGRQASDMMMMKWDSELEKLAQNWAEKCTFKHSPDTFRIKPAGYNYIGENLYATTAKFDPAMVIQSWYDEVKDYDYSTLRCKAGEMCGHYTQVVWANSKAVGCGVKYCDPLEDVSFKLGYIVVCHYGPGGNYRGQKPYKMGDVCSQCPKETQFCVRGLCALRPQIGSGVPLGL